MKRKIYATLIAGALAVSMMGTTVMAYDGTTNFKYTPGTSGPTDPINPGDEETDPNNWMVSYPRNITLMDNNEGTLETASTKGQELIFKVKQRQAGSDNSDAVSAANVGAGIVVAAGGWASGTDIDMAASAGTSTVKMNLTNDAVDTLLQPGTTMMTLTSGTGNDEKSGYAIIKEGEVSTAVEGVTYTKAVTFSFTQS